MRAHIIATKGSWQWQGIPAIERAPNGRLWSAFFTGGPKEPDPAKRNRLLAYLMDDDSSGASPSSAVPGDAAGAPPCPAATGRAASPPGLALDGRDNGSYPDAVQAPDGAIYAVHDCERRALGEIVLNVFAEDEIPA